MPHVGETFRSWVLDQRPAGVRPHAIDNDKIRLETTHSLAEVNFYPYEDDREICELRITQKGEDDSSFFLHFMLDELDRAQELFDDMATALAESEEHDTTRVLLCCTSALTTTLFATKMGEVARTLGLDYEFSALSYDRALLAASSYDAVLLAPQVAHLRQEMAARNPGTMVFEIPGQVFGSYDAAAAVRLLMHALRDDALEQGMALLEPIRNLRNHYRILVITLFSLRKGSRLGYRLYDHGKPILEGLVRKPRLDFRDIEDLMETMGARSVDLKSLDAVGIAAPGIVSKGSVRLPGLDEGGINLGPHLTKRFNVPFYVDNNCNAAAVACYVSQSEYNSVSFFRQEFGHFAGGLGTVLNGRVVRGNKNLAGEPKFFEHRFAYEPYTSYDDARWTAEGMFQIATNVCTATISIVSPEALYVAVDTVDDVDALRAELAHELGDEFVPAIYLVSDYIERVYLGELALCVQKLRAKSK